MVRSRFARACAFLVLIVAQGAFALPPRMHCQDGAVRAPLAAAHSPMAATHAQHGGNGHDAPVPRHSPVPSCPACPGMPGNPAGGSCLDMASCGPSVAAPAIALVAVAETVATPDAAPAFSAPAAHDFIPDPPPPRA